MPAEPPAPPPMDPGSHLVPAEPATVTVGDRELQVDPSEELTFGRAETCTACLDPTDLGISRLAGSVSCEAGTWWVVNRSSSRPLDVIDDLGIRSVLPPGRRVTVDGPLSVVVEGSTRRHALQVVVGTPTVTSPGATPPGGQPTSVGEGVVINDADRLALVALFRGYLEAFPRHDPHPRSYADAAAQLGWPRTTLVKRIEYLRTRLSNAGVPGLVGENALEALATFALTTGVITREDLALLP